jgi:hypothetical protein
LSWNFFNFSLLSNFIHSIPIMKYFQFFKILSTSSKKIHFPHRWIGTT